MADKTLKDQNRLGLVTVVLSNVIVLIGLGATNSLINAEWEQVAKSLSGIVPIGFAALIVGVLNAQLDPVTKAKIVFLRWNHPLPGSRAFTELGPKDTRVDMSGLKERLGTLPVDPSDQNSTWFRLYREVADKASVLHANREYLFSRDYHVLAIGMLVAFGVASIWTVDEPAMLAFYIVGLFLQALIVGQAARNHGRRLVCNVLALSGPLISPAKVAKSRK